MKRFRKPSWTILSLLLLVLVVWCNGEGEEEAALGAPMVKTERDALFSTIQGFVGDWWNGSDLYPDPCGWTPIQGVSCDIYNGYWYITSLTIGPIHDNSLLCNVNPRFKSDLFTFQHLKSFSLYKCFISPLHQIQIPTDNWELLSPTLEYLEIRSNPSLIGPIPTKFGTFKNLRSLVLLENGLTGKLQTNLGNLKKLRRLVLAGNQFTDHIPYSFGGLNDLLILDLSKNSLSGPIPLTFGALTSLLKLDLSNNQLEGNIPEEIGEMTSLTLLDLSKNKLSGGLTKSIQELNSLEELVLSNNPIGGELAKVDWKKLEKLAILDLSNTSLTGSIPESMSELKMLRFMGLNDNALIGDVSPSLEKMPSISAMYLNGNNLTGVLQFSESFYGKMGCRFGAWDNSNLCYSSGGLGSSGHMPIGVVPCQQEIGKSKLGKGNYVNPISGNVVSLGFSKSGIDGFWCVIVAVVLMIPLVL